MTRVRVIAIQFGLLCMFVLLIVKLSAGAVSADHPTDPTIGDEGAQPDAPACVNDPVIVYKRPWMIYGNDPTKMQIKFETDVGVDNDSNHIYIDFDQSGVHCDRAYEKMDIALTLDRRLWTFSCHDLEPATYYGFTVHYRDYYDGCWHAKYGSFYTPPAADKVPPKLEFYAYGDTRTYNHAPDKDDPIAKVAQQIADHHYDNPATRFIIHTGDIVPNGGKVAHLETPESLNNSIQVEPWSDQFFDVPGVRDMLNRLPVFTSIGNHDFESDDDDPSFYYRYFKYPMYGKNGDANRGYYRIGWDVGKTFYQASSWTDHIEVPGSFGDKNQGGGISAGDIGGDDQPDLIAFQINSSDGGNHGYYRIGWDVHQDTGLAVSWTDHIEIPGWYGGSSQGGGISVGYFNDNAIPDLVAFHIDDPDGGNHGYYRIGWDVDSKTGKAVSWTEPFSVPGWFGGSSQGGGISVGYFNDDNTIPDLVVFHIDDPDGANHGYYRVGWDVDPKTGQASSWTDPYSVPGWFGDHSQGGGISVGDFNGDDKPDLVAFHINNPEGGNTGYYRVGLDVDPNTGKASSWMNPYQVPGWYGDHSQGGGIAVGNFNYDKKLDLVAFHINNPEGENSGHYRIGWDMHQAHGLADSWMDPIQVPGWFGDESYGGGISVGDINSNKIPDLVAFHINSSDGKTHGYYRIGWDVHQDTGQADLWTEPFQVPGWYGEYSQYGGISVGDINSNKIPDLVAFHIDKPDGGNHGYYRIGWDVDPDTGLADSWTEPFSVPGWIGGSSQGGGISVGNFNNDNTIPDLVVFHIDDPDGGNHGYYRIGWDVDPKTGKADSWTDPFPVPGWFGDHSQGGGISVGDINGDDTPDLVVFHIDNPDKGNHGYYRIGWDVDPNTGRADSWTDHIKVPGWFGDHSSGGGIAVGDINGNGNPDISAFHINNRHPGFDPSDLRYYYYEFSWGPAIFYSITTFPMELTDCKNSTSVMPGTPQYEWIRMRLQQAVYDNKRPWKIVFMHAPPYDASASCNQRQVRDYLIPLFEEYGVDLVIAGHEHYYARKEVNGILYLVLGGGGADLSTPSHPEDMDFSARTYGFNYFEIDGDTMKMTAFEETGWHFDSITIDKSPKADFKATGATIGLAPLEVQFQNLSTGHIQSYEWDFGDDSEKLNVQNPTHIYTDARTYKVTLTAYSHWDTSTTKTINVVVPLPLPGVSDYMIWLPLTAK